MPLMQVSAGALRRFLSPSWLRAIGALALLGSLALPVYQCSHCVDAAGNATGEWSEGCPQPGTKEKVDFHYPLSAFEASDLGSWALLLTYTWPFLGLAFRRFGIRQKIRAVFWCLEPFALAGTAYVIALLSSLGERGTGAYVAWGGVGIYAGAWLSECVRYIRSGRAVKSPLFRRQPQEKIR